jgi:hypothetical protein
MVACGVNGRCRLDSRRRYRIVLPYVQRPDVERDDAYDHERQQ